MFMSGVMTELSSRSPHGERGLKFIISMGRVGNGLGRSPHGERGLKCHVSAPYVPFGTVAPRTGSVG